MTTTQFLRVTPINGINPALFCNIYIMVRLSSRHFGHIMMTWSDHHYDMVRSWHYGDIMVISWWHGQIIMMTLWSDHCDIIIRSSLWHGQIIMTLLSDHHDDIVRSSSWHCQIIIMTLWSDHHDDIMVRSSWWHGQIIMMTLWYVFQVKLTTVLCVTLVVGVLQIIMCFLKLGLLSVYFSQPFISACNVGAACQIITTQVNICNILIWLVFMYY